MNAAGSGCSCRWGGAGVSSETCGDVYSQWCSWFWQDACECRTAARFFCRFVSVSCRNTPYTQRMTRGDQTPRTPPLVLVRQRPKRINNGQKRHLSNRSPCHRRLAFDPRLSHHGCPAALVHANWNRRLQHRPGAAWHARLSWTGRSDARWKKYRALRNG